MKKSGISLSILGITLIIMSVLVAVVVIRLDNSIDDSKAVGFATELKEITESVQMYYLLNKELPIDEDASYSKTALLNLSSNSSKLQSEITINHDTSTTYYKIDMSLIAETSGLFGNGNTSNDFYVVSEDGSFVYYPLGVNIGDDTYFSLTNKLIQITDINVSGTDSGDVTAVTSAAKISVTKSTNAWTKSLGLAIQTTLASGENLYYVLGETKTKITGLPYTLTLSSSTSLNGITKVVFQKENSSGKVIAKTTVDITNLDVTAPTVGTPVVNKYTDYTSVEFTGARDDKSQIAKSYYTTSSSTYTAEQIVALNSQGGTYSIKLASDATYVQFVLVDNAGNISAVKKVTIE